MVVSQGAPGWLIVVEVSATGAPATIASGRMIEWTRIPTTSRPTDVSAAVWKTNAVPFLLTWGYIAGPSSSVRYWMAALAGPAPTDWSSRDEHACRVARDAASDLWPRFLIVLMRADPPIGRSTAASSAIQPNAGAGKPALSAPQDMRSSVCEGRRLAGEVATPNQFQEARPLSRHLQMVRISSAQY